MQGAAEQAIEQAMKEMMDRGWVSWEQVEVRQELETVGHE
jgi:hypothetical protein